MKIKFSKILPHHISFKIDLFQGFLVCLQSDYKYQVLFFNLRYTVLQHYFLHQNSHIYCHGFCNGRFLKPKYVCHKACNKNTVGILCIIIMQLHEIYNNSIAVHLITTDLVSDKYFCVDSLIYIYLLMQQHAMVCCAVGCSLHVSL